MTIPQPVGVGLIGAGWIGTFHGGSLAHRVPGARLVSVADPAPGAAARLADRLGGGPTARTALRRTGFAGTVGLEAWAAGEPVAALAAFRAAFAEPTGAAGPVG